MERLFFALQRGGWGVVATHLMLAAVAKEVHKIPFLLDRFLKPLLYLLDGDKDNAVALGVQFTKLVLHLVGGGVGLHIHNI